jgi:hypothetical protein
MGYDTLKQVSVNNEAIEQTLIRPAGESQFVIKKEIFIQKNTKIDYYFYINFFHTTLKNEEGI